MVELAKPLSVCGTSAVFDLNDIAAERVNWQKEIDQILKVNEDFAWKKARALNDLEFQKKQNKELKAALDKEVVRADCLLKALKTTENILSDTKAALDKVEDTIVATMKRADKAEAKCQNCPLKLLNPSERETVLQAALAKAEARVRELEAALYKKGKWNPEIDEVERILRNAIDKSLPKEARLKRA